MKKLRRQHSLFAAYTRNKVPFESDLFVSFNLPTIFFKLFVRQGKLLDGVANNFSQSP